MAKKKKTKLELVSKDKVVKKLNEAQELFCQYYIIGAKSGKKIVRFVAYVAYAKAYGIPISKTSLPTLKVNSSKLKKNATVKARIAELLEEVGYDEDIVRAVHADLIVHPRSWKARRDGVKLYYQVTGKLKETKVHKVDDPLLTILRRISENK